MPAARLNRDKLQRLAEDRLKEAALLMDRRYWTGAYYLTGLAVECALKACLALAIPQHDFPDKKFVNDAYTHDLEKLLKLDAALWVELQNDIKTDVRLATNLATVLLWNDEYRYEVVEELQAASLFAATTESVSGLMEWVRRRW